MTSRFIWILLFLLNSFSLFATSIGLVDSLKTEAEYAYYINANDSLAYNKINNAISILESYGIKSGKEYSELLSLLCQYGCDEKVETAIDYGEQALIFFETTDDIVNTGMCLSILGYCYSIVDNDSVAQINQERAIDYCIRASNIFKSCDNDIEYASALSHLIGAYCKNYNYSKALEVADIAINFADSCLNYINYQPDINANINYVKLCDSFSLALHNKAIALFGLGRYQECLYYNKRNLQFRLETWGKNGRYAITAKNLAHIERELGLYIDSYNHYIESYNTTIKIGRMTPEEALDYYCSFVDLYLKLGELYSARPAYGVLTQIMEDVDFNNHVNLYSEFLNIAVKYWLYIGDFYQANIYFKKSYNFNGGYCLDDDVHIQFLLQSGNDSIAYKKSLVLQSAYDNDCGSKHIRALSNLPNVIKASSAIGNWGEADSCAVRYLYGMRDQMKTMFPVMTNEDRELFLDKHTNSLFKYLPFFFNITRQQGFANSLYDLTLLQKGLLLRSEQEILSVVKNCNNTEAINLYNEISDNIARIKIADNWEKQDSLSAIIIQQQHRLSDLIPDFKNTSNHFDVSWIDIKNNLKDDEVAIEFIDIVDYYTGTKSCKALVIMPDCEEGPYFLDLFNESDLCNIQKDDYYTTDYLFALIWDPIEARLLRYKEGINNIYFSVSELTSLIALENLYDYWGHRVSENRNYYRVSSTREIINRSSSKDKQNAVIYGGLIYDLNDFPQNNVDTTDNFVERKELFDETSNYRSGIHYLPASKIESELITSEFINNNRSATLYQGADGTEDAFYSLNKSKVNILHIATHGFYWTQSDVDSIRAKQTMNYSLWGLSFGNNEDKALSRSGLFLSGANWTLKGNTLPPNMHDGILTAKEISKLDLSNLDLAVLSACETGLGDIVSGEGIMGLQRGFKKAGTNSILMSLWEVDDDATQELMVNFYKHFLEGKTKFESLRLAQEYIKSMRVFENPDYWAGWILLDAIN